MKFLTVFVALMSVAYGYQVEWTLHQLDQAISNPATDPNLLPYLEQALNEMMFSLFAGEQVTSVTVTIPAVDLSTWTLPQLSAAIQNPSTDPNLLPYLEQALNHIMESMVSGVPVVGAPVVVPAMGVSSWTLQELNVALGNPNTNPELIPYLEHALNEIMDALFAGNQITSVVVAIPVGLLPAEGVVAVPVVPVVPVESPIAPPAAPVVPTPVAPAPTPASALVQIIVNVNQKGAPAVPSPVAVADQPQPAIIVDGPAPVVNPVDILHPVPVVVPVPVGGDIVGPIV